MSPRKEEENSLEVRQFDILENELEGNYIEKAHSTKGLNSLNSEHVEKTDRFDFWFMGIG